MIWILIAYFALLMLASRWVRGGSNDDFFAGARSSAWPLVAFGMVGASLSGVSFVSVPGMVATQDWTYLQMCMGFIPGYLIIAFVLLPIYYRLRLPSIYSFLGQRLGDGSYRVGAWFFILSDLLGSAVKFYLVCIVLQRFVFDPLGVPFALAVPLLIALIWLYTRNGGVRTLVLTDVLQTACMLLALILIIYALLGGPSGAAVTSLPPVFCFDASSPLCFWRQFISGAFVVVVMTGLNQNMMQKNLTCRTLRAAQKNMCLTGLLFVPVNALLLLLGTLIVSLAPGGHGDSLLPSFVEGVSSGSLALPAAVALLLGPAFVIGIVSSAFSSADSSLTALTTSFCVDIARRPGDEGLRRRVHLLMGVALVLVVYILRFSSQDSLINLVYTLVGYTYGPLLGLFALALTSRRHLRVPTAAVLAVCLAAPAVCYLVSLRFSIGYELLMLNAALTFVTLKTLDLCLRR